MYKVGLVDDEHLVIKSLKGGIEWNAHGFEVTGEATDGEEALELIARTKPDLVFTDIRMPCLSGLDVMMKAKQFAPHTQFIVVSGYSEFDYAREAMRHGAIGYCLKPFEDEEVVALLNKAKSVLDHRQAAVFRSALEDGSDAGGKSLEDELRQLGFAMGSPHELAVIVSLGPDKCPLPEDVRQVAIRKSGNRFITIAQKPLSVNLAEMIRTSISLSGANIAGVGLVGIAASAELIEGAIETAEAAAYGFFMHGAGKGKVYLPPDRRALKEADALIERFEEHAARRDRSAALQTLDECGKLLAAGRFAVHHALSLYNAAVSFIGKFEERTELHRIGKYDGLCAKFRHASDMIDYLKGQLCDLLGIKYRCNPGDIKNETFKAILQYVNRNFYKDITVQEISKAFIINPSYLSQVFRKELRTTFSYYVTGLRMDYAKQLLKTTKLSVKDISERCGYNDYFYFIKAFKRAEGVTPVQYREPTLPGGSECS